MIDHLFEYFDMCDEIDFEESLIDILNILIPIVSTKTEFYLCYARNIEKLLDKTDFDVSMFFMTFYNFCKYGLNWIRREAKKEILDKVFYGNLF